LPAVPHPCSDGSWLSAPLAGLGFEVFSPEALGALVRADAEKWWPIIKELGIKPP